MNRLQRIIGLAATMLMLGAWGANNPSGDIQPMGASNLSDNVTGLNLILAGNGNLIWTGRGSVQQSSDGLYVFTKSDGTFASLLLGASGATTGIKLVPSASGLLLAGGDGTSNAVLTIAAIAGNNALATLGLASIGEITVSRAAGDAFKLSSTVNGRLSSDSQFGWASGSSAGTSRDVSFYRSAAGLIGVNNGSGTSPNGSMGMLSLQLNATSQLLAGSNGQMRITNSGDTAPTTLVSGLIVGSASAGSSLVYDSTYGLRAMTYNQAANTGLAANAFTLTNIAPVNFGAGTGGGTETGMGFPSTTTLQWKTNGVVAGSIDASQNWTLNGPLTSPAASLTSVNPTQYYKYDECDNYSSTLSSYFSVSGTANANSNSTSMGSMTAPSSHPGAIAVTMNGAAAGGAATGLLTGFYKKTAAITWRWRVIFQMPTVLSSVSNRYVFNVGSFNYNATAPWAGPYISYSDNLNSGNWTLNSSVGAGTTTTTNSSTAAPAAGTWHTLAITLVNGLFTYVLDGANIGTVTDANITTTDGQWVAYNGSIQIIPSSFTTTTYAFMDAYDILVTGLSR